MSGDPFAIIEDARVAGVLRRLHAEADRQTPGIILHYLPRLPKVLLGRALHFDETQIRGFYADKYIALEREQAAFCHLTARALRARVVVEFGTSFGVSTLWLAAAVRANGGVASSGPNSSPRKPRARGSTSRKPGSTTSSSFASGTRWRHFATCRKMSISC